MPTTATTTIFICNELGHVNDKVDDKTKVGKFVVFPTDLLGNWKKARKINDGRYPEAPYFYSKNPPETAYLFAHFNLFSHGQSSR
ncbi:hypothetical protein [Puia sp.]|uniref:hypothetical protein n=1 Tax=Puia sp. TaxID=2045100 RepID=UPI002F41273D